MTLSEQFGPDLADFIGIAMNSLFAAGGLIGALSLGYLANKVGRKIAIQIICVMSLAATIVSTASVNMGMFLFGRALQGFWYVSTRLLSSQQCLSKKKC